MLDAHIRPYINPPLDFMGRHLAQVGVTSHQVTIAGFAAGVIAMVCIMFSGYTAALVFLIINRLLDGLDGAVARHNEKLSDFGGFLDIVCDFIIYAGIVFAFAVNQSEHLFSAAFLMFSFVGPITSFLACAIIAAKHRVTTEVRGQKSFYYLGGLCEGTETALALGLMCLFPTWFAVICWIYGLMCWVTTAGRVYDAWVDFGED